MPNDYIRVGTSGLPKKPKKLKHGDVKGLVRGARQDTAYNTGGTKGLVKELERQRDEDRAKAADEGRPKFVTDANTPERLKKYVDVGMREEQLEDATKRSALHAVIQEGINKASGVDSKPMSVKELNRQAQSRLANMGKWGLGGAAYLMGRIMRPTQLGDSTQHGSYTYKKMGVQK